MNAPVRDSKPLSGQGSGRGEGIGPPSAVPECRTPTRDPSAGGGRGFWHIASFLVQHRPEAAAALDAAIACLPGTELALREGGRSVLLGEGADERALLDRIEGLREVPGVIAVSLVQHHAEPRESLEEEV